jgi:hypothetical protein
MTDETETRKKVLVVEDWVVPLRVFETELGSHVDLPIKVGKYGEVYKEKSLENIKTCLENTPYEVIFMDGQLFLELSTHICDGEVLVDRIRGGGYGSLNQNVEIQNISDAFRIPGTKKDVYKEPFPKYGNCPVAYVIERMGLTEKDRIFGEDDLSVRAISAFGELRNIQIKHFGADSRDGDTFTYDKIDGQKGEYTIGQLMECEEFVDFVRGYKGMRGGKWSKSSEQGRNYRFNRNDH